MFKIHVACCGMLLHTSKIHAMRHAAAAGACGWPYLFAILGGPTFRRFGLPVLVRLTSSNPATSGSSSLTKDALPRFPLLGGGHHSRHLVALWTAWFTQAPPPRLEDILGLPTGGTTLWLEEPLCGFPLEAVGLWFRHRLALSTLQAPPP